MYSTKSTVESTYTIETTMLTYRRNGNIFRLYKMFSVFYPKVIDIFVECGMKLVVKILGEICAISTELKRQLMQRECRILIEFFL